MQNIPPQDDKPEGTPSPAQNEQEDLTLHNHSQTYIEPQYQEYAPSGVPADPAQPLAGPDIIPAMPVAPAPAASQPAPPPLNALPLAQPGYLPQPPQPGYIPQTPPPGYVPQPAYIPQPGYMAQPGYIPTTPPPGYIPATPQPGSIPPGYFIPTTPQPGYVPQPGYPPMMPQPGYPPQPGAPRPGKRNWLAIVGAILAVIVVLAIVLGSISLARLGNPTPASPQGTSPSPTTSSGHPTSAFEAAACPFQVGGGIVEGQQLSCGYVTVPENRNVKNGPKVKLAVAIFKAPQYMNSVDPAPVLRLDGGPGGSSLDNLAHYVSAATYPTFIFHHNVVMFDQRGTGYSTPSLKCPELIALQTASAAQGSQTYEQAAQTCYNRLRSQGIDLNGFNTLQNAADVSDLIHALGYKQMTIYGVSYGTRLALTVMHLYPTVVHAAVLDSVYPTNHNRNELPSDAQRVFNVLFQGCAKDPNCNAKYPNLQNVFYTLVDQFNAHPITFNATDPTSGQSSSIQFAGDDLVGFLFSTFYVTSLIPDLPKLIYQIKGNDYTALATIYAALNLGNPPISDGLFYSAECSEDWPFLTQQDITASEQNITPQIAKVFGQEGEQQEYDVCQFWKVQRVPASQKQPVVSSLPTLVVTGEYDPITPAALGQEAAKTLNHSYFFTFPGQGHGQEYSSPCSDQIISAFEDNPNQQPDGSCISQMTEPAFL